MFRFSVRTFALYAPFATVHPQSRLVCERCTKYSGSKDMVEKHAEQTEDKFEPQLQMDQALHSFLLRMGLRLASHEGRQDLC